MVKAKSENSLVEKELEKAEQNFKAFDDSIKEMTLDRSNEAPKKEMEQQTKLSSSDIEKKNEIYLKPKRTISSKEKFNEKFREDYNFAKEYVNFIAENKENIGETITMWSKPFPGMPAEEWEIPANKPIWAPRYIADQLKSRSYHRFIMQDIASSGEVKSAQYYNTIAVDTTIQRLDAHPVSTRKSIFMGSNKF